MWKGGETRLSSNNEHLAASKEEKSSSHFYFMYPSREGKRKEK